MHTASCSSLDRGIDSGHSAAALTPWKKVLAIAIVAIMVATSFAMLAPLAKGPASAPSGDVPARALAGEREVTYTISNIGESYLKDSRDVDGARGRHSSTPGLSEWWESRLTNYSDTVAHNAYPYYVAYQAESMANSYSAGQFQHVPYGTYGFYRFTFDAKNLTTVATGPGKDPLYLPMLGTGALAADGGTVQLNWHFTYLTTSDKNSMLAGTHYANTYYKVMASALSPLGTVGYANDGWYVEQTGTASFDRLGAAKFLGLENPSTSLIDQFNTANTPAKAGDPGPLNTSWWLNYKVDGQASGPYDITACYDYDIATGPPNCYFLSVDPDLSGPDHLVLRVYGFVWGIEALMMRYMDVQGLMHNFIPWPEDYYFNATITTTGANIQSRMGAVYHMTTWKDVGYWGPSLMLEAVHNDYSDQGSGWVSRFYDYMAVATSWKPTRAQYEPGTNNFGVECGYIVTPSLWNLATGEKLTVQLPTGPHMGYIPYKGTVSDNFPKQGGGNPAKIVEMNTHQLWGELVLSPKTLPSEIYTTYYNPASKTITINGPTSWAGNMNPHVGYETLYETGVPNLIFDVVPVSDYVMTLPAGPYESGQTVTMTVTAKNITGTTVNANGTVNLTASAGVTLGAASHKWSAGEHGVWTTQVTFNTFGEKTITATDMNFSRDVSTSLSVPVGRFDLVLVEGWNLVTVPRIGNGYNTTNLGLWLNDVVSKFDGWNYTSFTVNKTPASRAFAIEPNTGYWIYSVVAKTVPLYGNIPATTQTKTVTVPQAGGWFIVGYESLNATRKASDMKGNYTGGTLTTVACRNYTTGLYDTYTGYWRTDFVLKPGQGIWIYVTAPGVLSYNP